MMGNIEIEFEFDDFDIDGKTYRAVGDATADYYFERGKMYCKNGDPGWPDEEELKIKSIQVQLVTCNDDDDAIVTDPLIIAEIEHKLWSRLDDTRFWVS